MKVYISASSNLEFLTAKAAVEALGFTVLSSWLHGRQNDRTKLSSEQLTELADDSLDSLITADVLVSVFDRSVWNASLRGSAGWAGFALARGIPVIAVGPFDDTILYARRVVQSDWESLPTVLTKLADRLKLRDDVVGRFNRAQRSHLNTTPPTGSTDDDRELTPASDPSGPVRVEGDAPGEGGGADGDGAPAG